MNQKRKWTVIDLFSGAGGMSFGFHSRPGFRVVGAVDAQIGKPSSGVGSLQCNDLSTASPQSLKRCLSKEFDEDDLTVLIACAPCTGFSRTLASNHIADDPRNSLVRRCAGYVEAFKPAIFLMENARELMMGRFSHHFRGLSDDLADLGYHAHGDIHLLNRFGLPQQRERALLVAVKDGLELRTIDDLWSGYQVKPEATTVRRAISWLPPVNAGEVDKDDALHAAPSLNTKSYKRLSMIPKDGGSWSDLIHNEEAEPFLTPAMLRYVAKGDFGSHPDVYGRLWWDRPAVTIKRECAHIGNGRYAHPEQNRLCTVREMSILQGFPKDYCFVATGLSNLYRHIGDAVPPLIAYQLALVCEWILTGKKPDMNSIILPNTNLRPGDIIIDQSDNQPSLPFASTG
jgi:DNA (cytosine-5)-methyltransferase 1